MTTPEQPYHYAPKRNLAWLWVLLVAAGLIIITSGLGAVALVTAFNSKDGGQGGDAAPAPEVTSHSIGEPVVAGKFEFVVRDVRCGVEQVGTDFLIERAQGQFCLVTLSVKNIADVPETLFDRYQTGLGTNGLVYGANSAAGIAANDTDSQVWVTEINPGNELTGTVVYDLPQGVELAQIELHDSTLTGGAKVDLK